MSLTCEQRPQARRPARSSLCWGGPTSQALDRVASVFFRPTHLFAPPSPKPIGGRRLGVGGGGGLARANAFAAVAGVWAGWVGRGAVGTCHRRDCASWRKRG